MEDTEKIALLYKEVFNTPKGTELLEAMAIRHHYFSGTFSEDANKMYFKEGERGVISHIIEMCDLDLDYLREMRKSYQTKQIDPRTRGN